MVRTYGRHAPRIHGTAFVHDSAEVIGRVSVGKGASIWPMTVVRGDVHRIVVGEDANIQDLCTVHCDHTHPTIIGRGASVGHGCVIHGCRIGERCLIGMGATVMECVIGKESLIGAGAVVPAGLRIPPRSLVLGLPARVIRRLTPSEVGRLKRIARTYAALARRHKKTSHVVL